MTVGGSVEDLQQGEASAAGEPKMERMRRLDEMLLVALRKGFEAREAGSFKSWR